MAEIWFYRPAENGKPAEHNGPYETHEQALEANQICPRCHKDLRGMDMYADFIHYVPGTKLACIPIDPIPAPTAA